MFYVIHILKGIFLKSAPQAKHFPRHRCITCLSVLFCPILEEKVTCVPNSQTRNYKVMTNIGAWLFLSQTVVLSTLHYFVFVHRDISQNTETLIFSFPQENFKNKDNSKEFHSGLPDVPLQESASVNILKAFDSRGQCLSTLKLLTK